MSSEFCFGLFGIEDDDGQKSATTKHGDKEVVLMSDGIQLNSKSCCICDSLEVKYCCPGCGLRSCSLDCVKEHKDTFQCDGKRNKTEFVKMNQFDQKVFMSGEY